MRSSAIFILSLAFLSAPVTARDKGILNLDSLTFDKVVGGPYPVLVRFDKEYPVCVSCEFYFAKVVTDAFECCSMVTSTTHLKMLLKTFQLVPQSQLQLASGTNCVSFVNPCNSSPLFITLNFELVRSEWGEKENQDLADKFKVKKDQWPVYMFFPKESTEGVTFQGDKKSKDAILRFVRNQGVYVGLTGCVEKFDELAKEFIADKSKRSDVLKKAEDLQASDKKNSASAKHYVSIMKKIIESGDGFIKTESERLNKMIKDKSVKPDKKKNFEVRSNILHSFAETKSTWSDLGHIPQPLAVQADLCFGAQSPCGYLRKQHLPLEALFRIRPFLQGPRIRRSADCGGAAEGADKRHALQSVRSGDGRRRTATVALARARAPPIPA
jgi:hypothetical protein